MPQILLTDFSTGRLLSVDFDCDAEFHVSDAPEGGTLLSIYFQIRQTSFHVVEDKKQIQAKRSEVMTEHPKDKPLDARTMQRQDLSCQRDIIPLELSQEDLDLILTTLASHLRNPQYQALYERLLPYTAKRN